LSVEKLAGVVDELIEVLHLQARQLEKLIGHVEQVTAHLAEESEMCVIRSSLSGIHMRSQKLRGVAPSATAEGKGPEAAPGKLV